MDRPFSHPTATPPAALERRLRAGDRLFQGPTPGRPGGKARLMDHLSSTFAAPATPAGPIGPGRWPYDSAHEGAQTGITERNGIWVLTVDGVWRGDYRKRAQAEAAAARAAAKPS